MSFEGFELSQIGDVRGQAVDCGHFIPEEKPAETLPALGAFFGEGL